MNAAGGIDFMEWLLVSTHVYLPQNHQHLYFFNYEPSYIIYMI
jgi:hypothetical protein